MSLVDNHPATKPCPVSVANLAYVQSKLFEQTVLEEFLNEDESMTDTIDNLKQLFAHDNIGNAVSPTTLFNLRRALSALTYLSDTISLKK